MSATRAALSAGVGLLLSDRLHGGKRHKVGLTLIVLGALTTLPAAIFVRQGLRQNEALATVTYRWISRTPAGNEKAKSHDLLHADARGLGARDERGTRT